MDKTDTPEKEGLAETNRWLPLADKLGPEYAQYEYDSFLNPPPIRMAATHAPLPLMRQYQIWDFIRAQHEIDVRRAEEAASKGPTRDEEDERDLTSIGRIHRALDVLGRANRTHKSYCMARDEKACMCGAVQQNNLVAVVRIILEGRDGPNGNSDNSGNDPAA